jgi:protein transport protein SEC24
VADVSFPATMSAPHDAYGQYPPQQPQDQAGYVNPADAPPPAPAATPAAAHHETHKKKKRTYAAGAFEVGMGGNAVPPPTAPGAPQFGAPAPAYGGYAAPGQPDVVAQPAYGVPAQPAYGAPQPSPAAPAAGYQAPDPYYSAPPSGAIAGLAAGMGAMNLGTGPAPPTQPPAQPRVGPLNQLYPTDLLNQPFNVAELDLPPPPIILPPQVRSSVAVAG